MSSSFCNITELRKRSTRPPSIGCAPTRRMLQLRSATAATSARRLRLSGSRACSALTGCFRTLKYSNPKARR